MINNQISALIPSQFPEFIRDNPDYSKFVAFIQAYYEWMEQEGNVLNRSSNILNYVDIDNTTSEFIDYFIKDFLPYFPDGALISKQNALRAAKELYNAKGTPSSYQFLFRILFDSDFDYTYTSDSVLRASDGTWYVAKSLKLSTDDIRFLGTKNLRVFGETSKSIANIENVALTGSKIEVFISDIERLFVSGETVRIVDYFNQDVHYYNGHYITTFDNFKKYKQSDIVNYNNTFYSAVQDTVGFFPTDTNYWEPVSITTEILTSKVVGQVSQVVLAKNLSGQPVNRGENYKAGDPVIIYDGLNPNVANPVGATAEVGSVTTGFIKNIQVVDGGYGYNLYPNTLIQFTGVNVNEPPRANVFSVNPDKEMDVFMFPYESIAPKSSTHLNANNYLFVNGQVVSANLDTKIGDALGFTSFATYPISSVVIESGGGGINQLPSVSALSVQPTDTNGQAFLGSMGMLAPIQIANPGQGYMANDVIVFSGGTGLGANAYVSAVDANGAITSIQYRYNESTLPHSYPPGGIGYKSSSLPKVTVQSANNEASGAVVFVPGIMGESAVLTANTQRVGAITTINVLNHGEDYVATPNVSIRVQDILVSNADLLLLPQNGDLVYQGSSYLTGDYKAIVYSATQLRPDANTFNSLYNLRVFNYNSTPNPNVELKIDGKDINLVMANTAYAANSFYIGSPEYNANGMKIYGDGQAKAVASFLNGLVYSQGQYLNTRGQPSSYGVLQSENYNDYTYMITVEKEIEKYRQVLLNLLHPSGTKLIGRYKMQSSAKMNYNMNQAFFEESTLAYHAQTNNANVAVVTDFTTHATNMVYFYNLPTGTDLTGFITTNVPGQPNSEIRIVSTNGSKSATVKSEVIGIDNANNTVTLRDYVFLTYSNVAFATATSGSNTINITGLSGSYDLFNNGLYSNTAYPLMDIVYAGDRVKCNGVVYTVSSVDYITGEITTEETINQNFTTAYLSVNRNFNALGTEVRILGPIGLIYTPELQTESGLSITTEDGKIIILE
jgi:hypothetical protein